MKLKMPKYGTIDRERKNQSSRPEALLSTRSSKRVTFDNNDWNRKVKQRDSDSG